MNSTAAVLDRVVADLDRLLGADALSALTDAERRVVLSTAGEALRRVEAVVVETVATADSVDLPNGAGCRNMNELLQRTLRVDSRAAARFVKAGRLVHRDTDRTSGESLSAAWPALRQTMLDGAIGVSGLLAATGPIESAGDRIGGADRWEADAVLADVARGHAVAGDAQSDTTPPATPEDLKTLAHAIAVRLDPDGAEPVEHRAMRRRYLSVGRLCDGVYPMRGNLLPETYAQLQLLMDAQLNPKTDGPPIPEGVAFRPLRRRDKR
ncbi:DUF222 domain-containing protein [Microbacterium alcoholitolerans]|uniref:DUF222 domain-containing protein n=1 Tax=unclassified Microbacterium TaxID=2609290 RepID=UPI003D169076